MWNRFSAPRSQQTTIQCKICSQPLIAKRTCHEAYLYCPACRKDFLLQEYVKKMDELLEDFLEKLNCDRI